MSDEQTLLAVIAAIYLADCVFWIPRNGLGFTRWVGAVWNLRQPSTILGNDRGALAFANPLPPLGIATRGAGWTISIMEQGIGSCAGGNFYAGVRGPQEAFFYKWAQIEKIERDEKKIFVNGQPFATAISEYSARWMAQELVRLLELSGKKRANEIEKAIERACDDGEVSRRVANFLRESKWLRYVANGLFIFLFGACPFLVWKLTLAGAIWLIVIGIYAHMIVIAALFLKAHRKIYAADSGQIFKPFLTMLLAAPSAIRAQDILGRSLAESFHPLAVAKALCSVEDFERFAGTVFRDLNFPRGAASGAKSQEGMFQRQLLKGLETKLGLRAEKFLQPPQKSESVHTQYCQRCLQQFTEAATNCPDCGGRPLAKF